MSKKPKRTKEPRTSSPPAEAERSEAQAGGEDVRRGRPGRRSAQERTAAVLELLSGKATVDQLAFRFGVHAATIEAWRQEALVAVEAAMRQGGSKPAELSQLEKEHATLEKAFTRLAMKHELLERALSQRPSHPGMSSR